MALIQRVPIARVRPRLPWWRLLCRTLGQLAWGLRRETILLGGVLAVAVLVQVLVGLSETSLSLPGAVLVTAAAAAPGLVISATARRWLHGMMRAGQVGRRFARACRYAGLATENDRVPQVVSRVSLPAGERLRVKVPAGGNVSQLEDTAETLAAYLRLRELRVRRYDACARYADVTLVRRDPLIDAATPPWPHLNAARLSLWDPVPVGVDEDGEPVLVNLIERNVLLGGEPGAGKSAALSLLVAAAALDPDVRLTLLDGKLVELAVWNGCAERAVGVDVDEAVRVLALLREEMEDRYRRLLETRRRKVEQDDGLPLHVVVVDELAHYVAGGGSSTEDRKRRAEVANLLRDLVSRGRAAGVIVLAATQKPSSEVVPTALRDLFGFRWALRCSTPQASDTILGQGWAGQGYSAGTIDAAARGVGYLLHEGGEPTRLRAHYLSDAALESLARRSEKLRAAARSEVVHSRDGDGAEVAS